MQEHLDVKDPQTGQLIIVRDEEAVQLNIYTGQDWKVVKDFGYMDEETFSAFMMIWPQLFHLFATGVWLREKKPGAYAH